VSATRHNDKGLPEILPRLPSLVCRAKITISDRRHLEKAACNYYPLLRRSLDRLYQPDRTPPE
jgi:hypothetical protein